MSDKLKIIEFMFTEPGVIINPHYEPHKRGRNWACTITGKNSLNFDRHFQRTSGRSLETSSWNVGDAIELGGDYITGGGTRHADRGYYLIVSIDAEKIVANVFATVAKLLKEKNKGKLS